MEWDQVYRKPLSKKDKATVKNTKMEKIEVLARSEWIHEPTHLELAIDKESFVLFAATVSKLTDVAKDVHSVDLAQEVYAIPEESEFREGYCMLKVFPKVDISWKEWEIYQSYRHKHNYEEMVESEAFTIEELEKHFMGTAPYTYHLEVDQKVTMWKRCKLDIVADNEKQAIEKAIEFVESNGDAEIEGVKKEDAQWETLLDTSENMTMIENHVLANLPVHFSKEDEAKLTDEDKENAFVIEVVECYKKVEL